jgi:hypothetical protein
MLIRPALLLMSLAALVSAVPAQDTTVGEVGKILVVGSRTNCSETGPAPAAGAVRIRRPAGDILLGRGQKAGVFLGDEYRLHSTVDVQLLIDSRLGKGTFTLAPQLMCAAPGADTTLRPNVRADTGSYQVGMSRGYLRLGVLTGGAFIHWFPGSPHLVVIAGGHRAVLTHTEIAVSAGSSDNAALLYVREGVVNFPEDNGFDATAGKFFELRPGVPPRELKAFRGRLQQTAESDIAFHQQLLSAVTAPPDLAIRMKKPGWPRWATYTIVAGAVGGAAYCGLASDSKCGLSPTKKKHQGTVVVRIPL